MPLLTKPRAGELDLETEAEREAECDRQRSLWNDVMDACRQVVREFGGYDPAAAALAHIWAPLGHHVTAAVLRAALSIESERNYFRGEWLAWFAAQSVVVGDLLAEIAGRSRPKKTPEEELRDLHELLRAEYPRQADKLIPEGRDAVTAKLTYMLVCDGEGCTAAVTTAQRYAHDARTEVVQCGGWTTRVNVGDAKAKKLSDRYGHTVDLCPSCSEPPLGILVDDSVPGRLEVTELRGPK